MLFDEGNLKRLAKSNYFQSIASNKELGMRLYANNYDLSPLQIYFIGLVNQYSSIYLDIAMNDVNPLVMNNEIYCDAYLTYKSKKREKEHKNKNTNPVKPKKDAPKGSGFSWIFKSPKKD